MSRTLRTEISRVAPEQPLGYKARRLAGRLLLAGVCVIPAADLAASDAAVAWSYHAVQQNVHTRSDVINHLSPDAAIMLLIEGESVGLGLAIAKTKKLKGAMNDMEDYMAEKQEAMSPARRFVSKVVNAPYAGLAKLGTATERFGEKISQNRYRSVQALGHAAVDLGLVNTMGTSGVIALETAHDNPPSTERMAWLGGLIAGTWVAGAEAVRLLYERVPVVRPPLEFAGHAFETLTTMQVAQPWETPIGTSAIILAAAALGRFGWQVGEYHQQKADHDLQGAS